MNKNIPDWIQFLVEEHNFEMHLRECHPEWMEHWLWLKEFSPTSELPEEEYTIDNNL